MVSIFIYSPTLYVVPSYKASQTDVSHIIETQNGGQVKLMHDLLK